VLSYIFFAASLCLSVELLAQLCVLRVGVFLVLTGFFFFVARDTILLRNVDTRLQSDTVPPPRDRSLNIYSFESLNNCTIYVFYLQVFIIYVMNLWATYTAWRRMRRRVLSPCSGKTSKPSRDAANKNELLQNYSYASPKRLQTSTGLHSIRNQKFTHHNYGRVDFIFYTDYGCLRTGGANRGAPTGRWGPSLFVLFSWSQKVE
jgi:hypothetical protein